MLPSELILLSNGGLSAESHTFPYLDLDPEALAEDLSMFEQSLAGNSCVADILPILQLVYSSPGFAQVDIKQFIRTLIFGPLGSGQYKLFSKDITDGNGNKEERVVGFFSYAFLDEASVDGYWKKPLSTRIWKNLPEDGELYVIDFFAPFGDVLSCCRGVHREIKRKFGDHPKYEGQKSIPLFGFRLNRRPMKWNVSSLSCRTGV